MIVFRQKQYVIPDEERFIRPTPFMIPNEWIDYKFEFEIIESGSYKRETNSRTESIWKEWRKMHIPKNYSSPLYRTHS